MFLKYHTLINSIPQVWKDKLKTENINVNNNTNYLINQIINEKGRSNLLYVNQIIKKTNKVEIKSQK